MIRFPYGLADFYRIVTEDYLYLDRTAHIHRIEALGDALLFVRPRRFGKSLWLTTLASYYDLRLASDFEHLFGGLDAGRDPTPLANRYFILQWDFSEIDPSGSVEDIGRRLRAYVNGSVADFNESYADHLVHPVAIEDEPAVTLGHLLTAIRQTPYRLYLLIDEYDNFVNETMVSDEATYRGLVQAEGSFKQLFKSIKSALAGRGLERVFLTGVSPVALTDLSSGFNVARNIYRHPHLNALCGFTEGELEGILKRMVEEGSLEPERAGEALELMRDWYDGYRFAKDAGERIYNPTNCFYFLRQHGSRRPPVRAQVRAAGGAWRTGGTHPRARRRGASGPARGAQRLRRGPEPDRALPQGSHRSIRWRAASAVLRHRRFGFRAASRRGGVPSLTGP